MLFAGGLGEVVHEGCGGGVVHPQVGLDLYDTAICSTLDLPGATLDSPDGLALRARGLSVAFDAQLSDELTVTGGLDFSGAALGGALDLSGAHLVAAAVMMTNSTVGTLRGHPAEAPASWDLTGFAYAALDPYRPATVALRWIGSTKRSYHPQPYEQLAKYYRSLGHDDQARSVQLVKQRRRRRGLRLPARVWGHVQDVALGYGYRPGRALLWLVAMVTAMATYFAVHPPHAASASAPRFQPVIYAVDILIPVLNLGLKNAYVPTGAGQWIAWAGVLAGWILATTVIAAITRARSRD